MHIPDNRHLAMIAGVGALACLLCSLTLPPPSAGARADRHVRDQTSRTPWATLERLQFENRQLRNRIHNAGVDNEELEATELTRTPPATIAVPNQWLLDRFSALDHLEPDVSPHWAALFMLTDEENQKLKDTLARCLKKIRAFEASHASTVRNADGSVQIVIEPFDSSAPSTQSPFYGEMVERFAAIVGEDRAQMIAEPLQRSTYYPNARYPSKLSFKYDADQLIAKCEIGFGELHKPIRDRHEVQSLVNRYGHLLDMESAAPFRQALERVLEESSRE